MRAVHMAARYNVSVAAVMGGPKHGKGQVAQDAYIQSLHGDGLTPAQIGKVFNRSETWVRRRLLYTAMTPKEWETANVAR